MDEANRRGSFRYVAGFLILVTLTALEISVIRFDVERAARITTLVGLAIAKAALLLFLFMDLRSQSWTIKALAAAPLILAPGFTIVLMVDAVHRATGAR